MERLRTLLLTRSQIVWLDPDRISSAQTRPLRDSDLDKLEDELAQLGYVMSLDLAMAVRRLPTQTMSDLRAWLIENVSKTTRRPHVPLYAGDGVTYLRRVLTWLATRPEQPCPWCGQIKAIGALDPCGHLVCRTCWAGGNYAGCPICHRRVALHDPFVAAPTAGARVEHHGGQLALLQLGFDLTGMTRAHFERLLARNTALTPDERGDLEAIIDAIGPAAASWLPARIPLPATMAFVIARLLRLAPDRGAIARAAEAHVRSATDVLRIACVLLGGNAELAAPMRFTSMSRGLRRVVLEMLEKIPPEQAGEDVARRAGLWKRAGEQLHPGEYAKQLPNAAAAFAIARGERRAVKWARAVEDGLRAGDAVAAVARLRERPGELLARVDHVVRVAQRETAQHAHALDRVLAEVTAAVPRGAPSTLLALASHIARRGAVWPRRVFVANRSLVRAWGTADAREPLRADAIGAITTAARGELVARAEALRNFPRAVIDRALVDVLVPFGDAAPGAWPRGSELALPEGQTLAVASHDPVEISLVMYDESWRHVATWERGNSVDFHIERLYALGARHLVFAVFGETTSLAVGAQRFELQRTSPITLPLSIDLAERRMRWLDAHVQDRGELHRVGGYRAALAHAARDLGDFVATHARPTMWELACIHAGARANVVYVRERDATFTMYRRRDREKPLARLARLLAGTADSFRVTALAKSEAPTFAALVTGDVELPAGSVGYVLDATSLRSPIERVTAADLVAQLAPRHTST